MTSPRTARRARETTETGPVRVMLVDDHPMWRDTLRRVLEAGGTATVIAEASDGEEAVSKARQAKPDVIVMDIVLPRIDGVEVTRRLQAEMPAIRVLVLSSSDERSQVLRAVQAGAAGYLVKTTGPAEVAAAIRRIQAGELVFPPALAAIVLDALRGGPARTKTLIDELTLRERDVLALMAEGRSNQAICRQLHLSAKTVEGYVANIFTKLGLEPVETDNRRVRAVLTFLQVR